MRALPRTAAVATAVVVVVAAMALVLGPGGVDDRPPTAATEPSPTPLVSPPTDPGADYGDPTQVCLRFAGALYRHDTGIDASARAAQQRAMAYATGRLASAVDAQPDRSDAQWSTWQSHRAVTDPTAANVIDADEQPADGPVDAYRAARVTFTPVGADGWYGPAETWVVFCVLHRDEGGWRVAHYDLDDLGQAVQ
ncbi:hypothetical protein SAMN05421812_12542 [Asanoa hainanensis]|uniref:Mce-associated membrane protein n=1 Tax=Asanoa hainanensis TaxID=560556 RepID=A0A239PH45_9ACTN|nr:hypothetical protein [Asanoa hainanensis]SNT65699.1 hypothetical protein SAMN05421812_12542 [Asanoa hainanensis]